MLHISRLFLGAKIKGDYDALYYVIAISATEVTVCSATKFEGRLYRDCIQVQNGCLPPEFSDTIWHEVPMLSGSIEYKEGWEFETYEAALRYGVPYAPAGGVIPVTVPNPFDPFDRSHMARPLLGDMLS